MSATIYDIARQAGVSSSYDADGYLDYGTWEKIMCSSDGGIFNRNEF